MTTRKQSKRSIPITATSPSVTIPISADIAVSIATHLRRAASRANKTGGLYSVFIHPLPTTTYELEVHPTRRI